MFLGRVIGRVVTTRRVPGLDGERLLIVMPLDETGEAVADSVVACDVVGSGPGDVVHVCDGREATLALRERFVPIDATIVGHVEQFAHDGTGGRSGA
jgi:ethanolamine utilization protein EutN